MGANFADGRGNVTMNIGYTNREAVFQGQRDFSTFALGDGADGLEPGGSSGVPAGHLFDSFTFSDGSTGQAIFTDGGGIRPWVNAGANSDRYNYAPVNYLQLPQERFNTTTVARYEITPEIEAYARFTGAFNQVPQQLAPTPAFTTITIGTDNPFLTPEAADLLAQLDGAYGDPVDGMVMPYLGRRMLETGARASNDDFFAFQFQAGLRGEFGPGIGYDVFFQTGRTQTTTT